MLKAAAPLPRHPRRTLRSLLLALSVVLLGSSLAPQAVHAAKPSRAERKAQKEAIQKLPEKYQQWLAEIDPLITEAELAAFLALEKDYQRDAFIKRFWDERDQYKGTSRNEFRDRYEANLALARQTFGDMADDRAHIFLLNGPPAARIESRCSSILWPLEI